MDIDEIIAAVDIGSDNIVAATGKPTTDNKIEVIYGAWRQCKKGLKNGIVTNISALSNTFKDLMDEMERESGNIRINDLYVGVRGSHIESMNNKGIYTVTRTDKEIISEDVFRVIENAKAIHLPNEREIIHIIPQDFSVDKEKGFENPVGMEGNILETNVHIVTANISHLNNISKTIANSGFGLKEHIYHIYAIGEIVLTEEEKKLGCAIIDIGDQITSVAIYYDGKIRFSKDIPLGSYYITNDIAFALHIPFDVANNLKETKGYAMSSLIENEEEIDIISMDRTNKKKVSTSTLVEYIKPRVEELLVSVRETINKTEYGGYVNGIVITGGGSLLKGMKEAVERVFKVSDVRYGGINTDYVEIKDKKYTHQKYLTAISLLCYPVFIKPQLEQFLNTELESNGLSEFFKWVKKLFS
ncbi:MAG: cell division protein FtsA [Elusimicrobiota bacterium]